MAQASDYPYCNTTTDLQLAFKDIEKFSGSDTLSDWSLTSGETNTYEKRNVGYYGMVYQNGEALTEQTSVADVESNASSFYYDSTNDILYVHMDDSNDPDTADIITASIDDWATFKQTMRNQVMEMMEGMLDPRYPRPLPFAAQSYTSANYDFDIRYSCALLTCALIIKSRDPDNMLADEFIKNVWNPQEDSGILWEYSQGRRSFSFETTKDEFWGNVEVVNLEDGSSGKIYIAGNPTGAILRQKYRIIISTGGVPETAKYTLSDDGGLTYTGAIDTYEHFTHLIYGIWIRFEGTFVADDEWEIIVADSRQKVKTNISSIDINVSGYYKN